jgi:hypothetical protein
MSSVVIGSTGAVVKVGGPTNTVVLDRRTVQRINDHRPRVTVSGGSSTVVSQKTTSVVTGGAMGVQGPPGVAGTPGGTVQPVSFSYGDAPGTVYAPTAAGTVTVARVVITTPFNGTAPTLQLGTLAVPDAAMAATDSDPTTAGEYEVTADLQLAAGEALRITITPDGSTAGTGLIYLTFIPD